MASMATSKRGARFTVGATVVLGIALAMGTATLGTMPAAHATTRNPVLIVAGLSSPAFALDPLAARLRTDGYTVYTMALRGLGFGDIAQSAQAVSTQVDAILASTGAAKVDLVGHSEGGLENRYYMKFLNGAAKIGSYVSLGTPQYGTLQANIIAFFALGNCLGIVACQQMTIGSSFLTNLNAGDDTPGTARYVSIYTIFDELVQPYTNSKLFDGASNVSLQSKCPLRVVGHLGLILDGAVYGLVRSALAGGSITTNCFAL